MKKPKLEEYLLAIALASGVAICIAVWNLYVWVPV